MTETSEDRFLTIKEVSELTRFPVSTLYQWVHRKRIPFTKKGNRLRFSLREVTAWMNEGAVRSSE